VKEFYKCLGIIAIMLFSFYYTEKIAFFMQTKDPLYATIINAKENEEVSSVNAIIDGDYIIPGVNGLSVNERKSFRSVKSFGEFNRTYLVFDQVKPDVTLENHKDKIIRQGNKSKTAVTILLEGNNEHIKYFLNKNKNFSVLVNNDTLKSDVSYEQINHDFKNYKEVNKQLESNICYVTDYNRDFCLKNKKYLVEATLTLNSSNIASIKGSIESGAIIFVKENVKLEDLDIIVKQIDSQGLKFLVLSELITEEQ